MILFPAGYGREPQGNYGRGSSPEPGNGLSPVEPVFGLASLTAADRLLADPVGFPFQELVLGHDRKLACNLVFNRVPRQFPLPPDENCSGWENLINSPTPRIGCLGARPVFSRRTGSGSLKSLSAGMIPVEESGCQIPAPSIIFLCGAAGAESLSFIFRCDTSALVRLAGSHQANLPSLKAFDRFDSCLRRLFWGCAKENQCTPGYTRTTQIAPWSGKEFDTGTTNRVLGGKTLFHNSPCTTPILFTDTGFSTCSVSDNSIASCCHLTGIPFVPPPVTQGADPAVKLVSSVGGVAS